PAGGPGGRPEVGAERRPRAGGAEEEVEEPLERPQGQAPGIAEGRARRSRRGGGEAPEVEDRPAHRSCLLRPWTAGPGGRGALVPRAIDPDRAGGADLTGLFLYVKIWTS